MKKTYTVDVDGTLCKEECFTVEDCIKATPVKSVVSLVNKLYDSDFVIIYTARRNHLMSATFEWLDKHGIKYHAVSNRKIPLGNGYVDSVAIKP